MSSTADTPTRDQRIVLVAVIGLSFLLTAPAARAYEIEIDERTELQIELDLNVIAIFDERLPDDPDGSLDEEPPFLSGDETVFSDSGLVDNNASISIGGSRTKDSGLSAYFYLQYFIEYEEPRRQFQKPEDRYIGFEGDFGGLQFGAFDEAYENEISGVLNEFEYVGTTDFNLSRRLEYLLAYWSPELAGFSFAAQLAFDEELSTETDTDGSTPFTFVATYSGDLFEFSVGYDSGTLFGAAGEQLGAAMRIDLEPLYLAFKYDTINTVGEEVENDSRLYGVMVMYEYARGYFAAATQRIEHTKPVDYSRENRTEIVLHGSYNLNDFSMVYAEGARYGRTEELGDYFGVGLYLFF